MSIEAGRDKSADTPGGETAPASLAGTAQTGTAQTAGSADGTAALQAVDLTLGFGQRTILSNISTSIRKGAITDLIGPTGSGKTTLLRTFNRMNDKVIGYRHGGDVTLDGRSIWHPGVELMALRRRVGMLFQRPNPFPMSIQDNVTAGAKAHKLAGRGQLRDPVGQLDPLHRVEVLPEDRVPEHRPGTVGDRGPGERRRRRLTPQVGRDQLGEGERALQAF